LALNKEQKEQIVASYLDRIDRAQVMVWAHYRGVKVPQFEALRHGLRQAGAEVMVVKNTLLRLALEQRGLPYDKGIMDGPCAVTFIYGDIASAVRVVNSFARENEQLFQIAGGLVGGKVATEAQVRELVTLPSREVMLGRVVGGIAAPISALVGTLDAVLRGLVNVLDAHRRQLEGSAG